jgi:hypothetical protein
MNQKKEKFSLQMRLEHDETSILRENWVSLVGHWRLISSFFYNGQHLLQLSEVLEYGNASLGNGVNHSAFSDGSLFH